MDYPISLIAVPRAVRLVSTARLRDPILYLLLDDPSLADLSRDALVKLAADLAEIEGGTSARLQAQSLFTNVFPGGRPHANFVNAAFAYWRPRERNRFNDDSLGAWYAAFETQTSLSEVIFHIGRELERVQDWNAVIEWSEMWASFAGSYVDLRTVVPRPDCLHLDSETGYAAGNMLARKTRDAGHNGIIYPSVRNQGGTCLVALWPHAVQSVAHGAIIRTAWRGSRVPVIEAL